MALQQTLKLSTQVTVTILMIDNTDHVTGKTGLAAGLTIYASKAGGASAQITPTVAEIDSTNMKGVYSLVLTTTHTNTLGELCLNITATGADPSTWWYQIGTLLPSEGVSVTQWSGTAVSGPATAGIPDVNVKNMNNVAATSITTVNANVGTTQPLNFTGTAGSALVKSDMVDVAGAAVSTASAQIGVNAVNIGGTAAAYPVAVTSNVKKNQALAKFQFLMTDSTNHNPVTGKTVTCTRSIDGGAFAAGTLANVAEVGSGTYIVDFGAGDLNGNVIVLKATAASCDTTFERIVTQP